jgi:hypothetical protein
VAEPGVSDNYFAAGGDSIKAIRLVVKINEKTQAGIRIPDIFAYQTIEELASHISRSSSGRDIRKELEQGLSRFSEIKSAILNDPQEAAKLPDSHEDIYPLGSVERGMIYSSLLRPEEPLYYDQFVMRFHIEDISLFERAVGLLVQKHPILRTLYYTRRFSEQLKVVLPGISIPLAIEDIRHISPEEQRSLIKAYKEKDILNRFSFDGELLWHMQVFTVAPGDHYLVWSVHHAILDGWSVNVFNSELVSLCDALSRDLSVKPPSLKHSYRDYAAIMHGRQTSSVTADFWRQTLSGYTRNKLPFNITGKRRNSTSGMKSLYRYLDRSLLKGLESVAAGHEVSVKTVCLSAYLYLMKVTSSENDIVSGLVTHDRPEIEDGENILGCFLNTVPVRMDLRNVRSKKELIGKVSAYLRDLKQHELPLSDIALLTGEKTTQGNPVFDCLFNFLDFHVLEGVPGTHTLTFHPDSMRMEDELMEAGEMTNTLFDLEVSTTLGHFFVKVKYAPAFFDKEDMEYALELYTRILSLLADTSDDKINAGALLTSAERESALYTFNDTDTEFPSEKLLHMLFEEKASASPGSIALVQGTEKISYG